MRVWLIAWSGPTDRSCYLYAPVRKVGKRQWMVGSVVLFLGCSGPDAEAPAPPAATPPAGSGESYLRRPVSEPDTVADTQLTFAQTEYDFGRVRAGKTVRHHFAFTNFGPGAVRIAEVTAACGCTVGRYPTEPIDSGARATVEVIFATAGATGRQRRPVVVRANTVPAQTTLYLSGEVIP